MKEFGIFHLEHTIKQIVNFDVAKYGITRRGIFYKVVSLGFYPSTAKDYYTAMGKVLESLRLSESVNEEHILDATRIRAKPYIFSNPIEFLDSIRITYAT